MSFQQEMDKRLRRVCGVTNDELPVEFHEESRTESSGGCETCWFDYEIDWIQVTVYTSEKTRLVYAERTFDTIGEMMRELDEVDLGEE